MAKEVVNARFEEMDDTDSKIIGKHQQPESEFTTITGLERLLAEGENHVAQTGRNVQQYADDPTRRDEANAPHRLRIDALAAGAEAADPHWTPEARETAAVFDHDHAKHLAIKADWGQVLRIAAEPELFTYARQARAEGSLALAGLIKNEIRARGGSLAQGPFRPIGEILKAIPNDADRAAKLLARLKNLPRRLAAETGGPGASRARIASGIVDRGMGISSRPVEPRDEDTETDGGEDVIPPGLTGGQIAIHRGLLQRQGRRGEASEVKESDESDDGTDAEPTSTQKISEGLKQRFYKE